MEVCIRIGCFIPVRRISHPVNSRNLGAAVISNMDNEIDAFISTRINCYMLMGVFGITKDYDITGSELASVYIRSTCSDFLNLSFIGQAIKSLLPSDTSLRVPSCCLNCICNKLCINAFNIRKIVTDIIGHEGSTAQSIFLISCNVRCETCYGR